MYKEESEKIKNILNDIIIDIHHIGSTAIPGINAKPVIDILVEVKNTEAVERYNNKMEELGYEAMGEHGIPKEDFLEREETRGPIIFIYFKWVMKKLKDISSLKNI